MYDMDNNVHALSVSAHVQMDSHERINIVRQGSERYGRRISSCVSD